MLSAFSMASGGIVASRRLHASLVAAVLAAPLTFHEMTPQGRVMTRCADDLADVDLVLPFTLRGMLNSVLMTSCALFVVCVTSRLILVPLLPLTVFYLCIQVRHGASRDNYITRSEFKTLKHCFADCVATCAGDRCSYTRNVCAYSQHTAACRLCHSQLETYWFVCARMCVDGDVATTSIKQTCVRVHSY